MVIAPPRRQGEQDCGLNRQKALTDHDQAQPVHPVGEHAAERADHHHREQVGEGDDPEGRTAEAPGKPTHRKTLHPQPGVAKDVAGGVDGEVAVPERARDSAEIRPAFQHAQDLLTNRLRVWRRMNQSGSGRSLSSMPRAGTTRRRRRTAIDTRRGMRRLRRVPVGKAARR
jgi:hypothetical protein